MSVQERLAQFYATVLSQCPYAPPANMDVISRTISMSEPTRPYFPEILLNLPMPTKPADPRPAPSVPAEPVSQSTALVKRDDSGPIAIQYDMHGFNQIPARLFISRLLLNCSPKHTYHFNLVTGRGRHQPTYQRIHTDADGMTALARAVSLSIQIQGLEVRHDTNGHLWTTVRAKELAATTTKSAPALEYETTATTKGGWGAST
jgi:hypothetical protein